MPERQGYVVITDFLISNFYGIAGALVSLFMTQKVGVWKGLVSLLVGVIVSMTVPNMINDFHTLGAATLQTFSFVSGMIGMNLTLGIIRLGVQFRDDPAAVASNWLKVLRGRYEKEKEPDEK